VDGDILPILRDWGTRDLKSRTVETLLRDAADEIERLRHALRLASGDWWPDEKQGDRRGSFLPPIAQEETWLP